MQEDSQFNEITTFRLTYPECCRLAHPGVAHELLCSSERVDRLSGFTLEMWDILTGVVLQEWFSLRLPTSKLPWDGNICLPPNLRLNYCLDRTYARQAHSRIQSCYLSLDESPERMSVFSGYGLSIPDDFRRECEGLHFLARQADHFRSIDDYLFIVQNLYADGDT